MALRKEGIMKRDLVLGVFSLAALLGNLAWAASASDDAAQRLSNSANVLKEVANARDKGILGLGTCWVQTPQPWLEHATAAMKDIALAVAIRDLASVTTIAKVSSALKEIGELVTKQASGRVFDEYCGTAVKPRVPVPRPRASAA